MHIKFLGRGKGKGSAAINYVLGEMDHQGVARAFPPEILRGNPCQTGLLADSLQFLHKYRSAVIAWHPDDKPSDAQIQEVLNEFERVAFAGLEPDQYDFTAVLHRESDSVHVHIIIPRVELSSGKSFNPSPPGWHKDYDPLRDYFNEKYNWVSPDISQNPSVARISQPSIDALRKNSRMEVKNILEEYLLNQIEEGSVSCREEILACLRDIGFSISRAGKNYITIEDNDNRDKIRLKGVIYEHTWTIERTLKSENQNKTETTKNRESRIAAIRRELENRISERARYNKTRYERPIPHAQPRPTSQSARKPERCSEIGLAVQNGFGEVNRYNRDSLQWHLWWQLHDDAILVEPDYSAATRNQTQSEYIGDLAATKRQHSSTALWRSQAALRTDRRESDIPEWLQNFKISIEGIYDRTRTTINHCIGKIISSVQHGHDAVTAANCDLVEASSFINGQIHDHDGSWSYRQQALVNKNLGMR